jgi:hypothetical protein
MTSELPRYRCATERAFLPANSEIYFAKLGFRPGVGSRVEEDDEFYYEGEPGAWMDPVNDAAHDRVEARMAAGQRKSVNAEVATSNSPLKPPRSGLQPAMLHPQADRGQPAVGRGPREPTHAAPRRRSAKAS